jgi:hypothetical protein
MFALRKPSPRLVSSLLAFLVIATLSAGVGLGTHQPLAGLLTLVGGVAVLTLWHRIRDRQRWHAVLDDFARREMEREQLPPVTPPWDRLHRKGPSSTTRTRIAPRGA